MNLIRKNWLPICFAVITGLIIVLPQILIIFELGNEYQGINIDKTDSENYYSARVREVYDGHLKTSNPEFYEYKNEPYLQPALSEFILAYLAKMFFTTPAQIILVGKFIFPALLYLAIYFFSFKFTQSKILSLTIPLIVIFASKIISFPQEVFSIFNGQILNNTSFNNYSRPIHPQISSTIFFSWLTVFYVWLQSRKKLLFWLTAILFGLMFYIYLYSWILALTIMGVIFLLSFFNNFENGKNLRKKILFIVLIGFLISSFYWINFVSVSQNPYYETAQMHYGFYKSHQPIFGRLLIANFVILIFIYLRRKKDLNFYFLLSTLLAISIVINQQIITGIRFYPGHWHWYYTIPFSIFLILWLCCIYLNKISKKVFLLFFTLIILFSLSYGFLNQYFAYQNNKKEYINLQKYAQVFKWLEENTSKDDVILINKILRDKLLIYTHNNNYLSSSFGALYLAPYQRFVDNLYINLKLNQITLKNYDQYANDYPTYFYDTLFHYYYQRKDNCGFCYPESEYNKIKNGYSDFLSKDFEKELKKYRIDYAVWDYKNNALWNLDQYNSMDFIIEINNVRIYKII